MAFLTLFDIFKCLTIGTVHELRLHSVKISFCNAQSPNTPKFSKIKLSNLKIFIILQKTGNTINFWSEKSKNIELIFWKVFRSEMIFFFTRFSLETWQYFRSNINYRIFFFGKLFCSFRKLLEKCQGKIFIVFVFFGKIGNWKFIFAEFFDFSRFSYDFSEQHAKLCTIYNYR